MSAAPHAGARVPLERARGVLLGVGVGDALGLPCENLRPATIARRFGAVDRYRLLGGLGLVSDDTEQTAMVAEALLARGPGDPAGVARAFAAKLRLWVLLLPAGVGLATLRACGKLLLGFPPTWSGVRSAGNGAAMRAAPIALAAPDEPAVRDALIASVSRTTHTDPRAVEGAALVAHGVALLLRAPVGTVPPDFLGAVAALARPGEDLARALASVRELLAASAPASEAARRLGTTGFVVHTVPFALFCALRFETFAAALSAAASAGGDADTIAAIAGALAGARHGVAGIPTSWIEGLERGGRARDHLEALARAFAEGAPAPRPSLLYRILRGPWFLVVLLLEVARRAASFVASPFLPGRAA